MKTVNKELQTVGADRFRVLFRMAVEPMIDTSLSQSRQQTHRPVRKYRRDKMQVQLDFVYFLFMQIEKGRHVNQLYKTNPRCSLAKPIVESHTLVINF